MGHSWLPLIVKSLATLYLVEVSLLVGLPAIVLMFVPSKIDWSVPFHGIPMRVWAVVLARRRPGALRA